MVRNSALEQEIGSKKYREMIHKSSKEADKKNLPFTFLPKRKLKGGHRVVYECPECGNDMGGSNYTYMIVCSKCNKLVRVREGTFGGTLEK